MEATLINNSEIMTTKELFYSPILQLSNYSNIKHLYNVSRNYAWYWKYENESFFELKEFIEHKVKRQGSDDSLLMVAWSRSP